MEPKSIHEQLVGKKTVEAETYRGAFVTADHLLNVEECVEKFREILQRAFDGKRCRLLDVHFYADTESLPLFDYKYEEYAYKESKWLNGEK